MNRLETLGENIHSIHLWCEVRHKYIQNTTDADLNETQANEETFPLSFQTFSKKPVV